MMRTFLSVTAGAGSVGVGSWSADAFGMNTQNTRPEHNQSDVPSHNQTQNQSHNQSHT
jgi:hypothetical protein